MPLLLVILHFAFVVFTCFFAPTADITLSSEMIPHILCISTGRLSLQLPRNPSSMLYHVHNGFRFLKLCALVCLHLAHFRSCTLNDAFYLSYFKLFLLWVFPPGCWINPRLSPQITLTFWRFLDSCFQRKDGIQTSKVLTLFSFPSEKMSQLPGTSGPNYLTFYKTPNNTFMHDTHMPI